MATRTSENTQGVSYVEWSAVIAGSVLACAVSLVLFQFGNALGLSVVRFQHDDNITAGKIFAVGLWLLWVQLMASMAGGYLAGRMRGTWGTNNHESEIRDGAHGLMVWATSTLAAMAAASLVATITAFASQQGVDNNVQVPADLLRKSGVIFGFALAAISIVSAVAAWAMAVLGGDHRDEAVDASHYVSFRANRKKIRK